MILIAGAGIGGLTLAVALRQIGIGATVFERAEVLKPVGAGITVQINAMAALRVLKLAEAVEREGAVLSALDILHPSGRRLSHLPLAEVSREFGLPALGIRRSRLQEVLLGALHPAQVRTGVAVTDFQDDGHQVTVTLSDGTSATGDLLVGADGLHSVVRQKLWPDALRYSGYTSWRGITKELPRNAPDVATETWGAGARFGIVPLAHGELYWFATRNAPAGIREEPGQARARLLELFRGWHAPILSLLESTPETQLLRTDIHDRLPLRRWSQGRVTLLGDAAHPMTPNMGQGGCQAIEGAVVLARCLAQARTPTEALADYERRRLSRANTFVTRSFQLGRVAQWENAASRWLRDTTLRLTPRSTNLRQLRTLMHFGH
jgi:2-polyprenyl-6-methoxyphenol hydroxylase-like FAD-dependent oxidoreductase